MLQPVKAANPATATLVVPPEQVRVPPAGLLPIDRVTVAVLLAPVVIVLPPRSWTATTGCAVNACETTAPAGWVTKPSLLGAPIATVKPLLVADVRLVAVAMSVYAPVLSSLHPAKVATPLT